MRLGNAAFNALRALENPSLASERPEGADKQELLWDARKSARAAMRGHPSFLGGTHETGLALRTPRWTSNMGCYLCSSIMGYPHWPHSG
ncbi:hypothetical protein C8A00DRAFT_17550 [Chaetomidium leptoderma]|uniref:Uncharacterized protein n=1 Tax=Chaetomidium leptoderma TaxID=669021 RepID=A0AAN6VGF3_9PEZI|nr:hypothetical protein C8A00DRAFT_17550 [Chaetomidium leptoderma]